MVDKKITQNVDKVVKDTLADLLDVKVASIKNNYLLVEDLGVDSFSMAELAFMAEEQFGFEIPAQDAQNIKTVKDLISYINSKVK